MKFPVQFFACPLLVFVPITLAAQLTWDSGAAPDKNWSNFSNWSTDASPAGTAVIFAGTGTTANATTVGNIVDGTYASTDSLTSLTYGNTGASAWQVTQIASGQTLTVAGAVRVGTTQVGAGLTTVAALTGAGTLAVNAPASTMTVASSSSSGAAARATLDMSNLSTFTANVSTFEVGTGTSGFGNLYLADNSTITAGTLTTGGSGSSYGSGVANTILFGTTTALNVDTLSFGGNRTYGTAQFRGAASGAANISAVSGATLTLRGAAGGTSAVGTMTIGAFVGTLGGNNTSVLDLTGGSVDAVVTNLTVGSSAAALSQTAAATLSMAAGTFDSTTVVVGQTTTNNGGTGSLTGNLNVSGGTFTAGTLTLGNNGSGAANVRATLGNLTVSSTGTVNVAGNLVMGVRSGAATVTSTVNVSGGTLTVGGNLAEGAGTAANIVSTINLSGGVLDMTKGNVAVDTFTFTGGTLKNVASFTGNLAVQNSATLGFDAIDGTFTALTLTGALNLGASSNLSLSLANGFTPVTGFTLLENDLADSVTGSFATINGAAFGVGNSFTLTNNTGSYNFTLSYAGGDGNDLALTLTAVPEPSTCAMIAGGLVLGSVAWRRGRNRAV